MIYDDTDGMIAIGGSEVARSFKGVIGDAVWYRRRIVQPHEVGTLHFRSKVRSRFRRLLWVVLLFPIFCPVLIFLIFCSFLHREYGREHENGTNFAANIETLRIVPQFFQLLLN